MLGREVGIRDFEPPKINLYLYLVCLIFVYVISAAYQTLVGEHNEGEQLKVTNHYSPPFSDVYGEKGYFLYRVFNEAY